MCFLVLTHVTVVFPSNQASSPVCMLPGYVLEEPSLQLSQVKRGGDDGGPVEWDLPP